MKRACAIISLLIAVAAVAQSTVRERLTVDATDAPRNILHSTITIPVTAGSVTLVYPKWIPGNHRPTGPIWNVMGLHIRANGQEINWQRDLIDMYAFHLVSPSTATEHEVSFDH